MKTFGTVALKDDSWIIVCEPHVLLRLKRVFGKLSKSAHGKLKLSATPENTLDLQWFCSRYPMRIREAAEFERRAREHRERIALVDDLINKRVAAPPLELAIALRDYQRLAANVVLKLGSLLLADDVGLGKTATAIGIFSDPRTLPALVVTLTHLPKQWEAEIGRFAPWLRTHILQKGTPYDLTAPRSRRGQGSTQPTPLPDVVICNYHKLGGWADTLAPVVRSVVFDECQELRRAESNKYAAAKHVASRASYRMGLSATPFYNYGGEMWNVMEVLRPGALGTFEEFRREWCTRSYDKPRIRRPSAFGTYVREAGLMLRRTRTEVGRELPALTVVPHHVSADTAALDRMADAAAELARIILSQGTQEFRGQKMLASEEFSVRVRQATGIGKAPFVAEFVRLLVESGEKVVLYGWHREVYGIWLDRLADLSPALYTGTESADQKDRAKQRFISGQTPVLIMSLRAGAGVDGLQHVCRTVVFGELDWSPGVHEQCTGRIYRDGQQEPVMAYYLIADKGSDPIVADVLGIKRQQIEGVRDPHAALVQRLEGSELNVRRLAESFLRQRGLPVPEPAMPPVPQKSKPALDAGRAL